MALDELIQSLVTAQEEMLKHGIEANSVTLNGRKYGKLIANLPPYIKPTICGMAVKADYALPDNYDFFVQREPLRPITNADRIRAMTDEELADLLHHWWLGDTDYFKTFCFECKGKYPCHDDCLLGWLKQEVKE